ncbi:MAG: radical SAM protein [Myxococcota bacterium]|nr:radical SAM protein [Myxococcota bacterium]
MKKLNDLRKNLIRWGGTRASTRALLNTVHNETERRLGRGYLASNPTVIHLEPTTACNLGCKMCGRSTHWTDLVKNSAHMRRETFLSLEPFLRTARVAVLHGWGEPLLHPDFLWMVETCKNAGCMVTFHSNGLLIDEEMAGSLIDAGVDHITISIDGATPETYREVRGAELDVLIGNLRGIQRIKAERGARYPRITFKSVLMQRNLEELDALVEIASECSVEEIELENLIVYHPALAGQLLFDEKEQVRTAVDAATEVAESKGIRLYYGGIEEKDGVPACPFRNFVVTCDGTVGPCGAQRFATGNIHDTPLRDIWNSEELVAMREGYARHDLPTTCERCPGRTNNQQDHLDPELGYLKETLEVRQWEQTDRFQTPRPVTIDPPRPPCDPSTPAAGGSCAK